MAEISIKVLDIKFEETVFIPTGENELRVAKLKKMTYNTSLLKYVFVVADLDELVLVRKHKDVKAYRTVYDALHGKEIPLKTINIADKLIEAGFTVDVANRNIVMTRFKDFKISPIRISMSDAVIIETDDGIYVNFRQYKTVTIEGVTCYVYDGGGLTIFKSKEDALKAKPIKVYRF